MFADSERGSGFGWSNSGSWRIFIPRGVLTNNRAVDLLINEPLFVSAGARDRDDLRKEHLVTFWGSAHASGLNIKTRKKYTFEDFM